MNKLKQHHITIKKTARYYTLGDLNGATESLWIVCHGYAQLASDFIMEFESLANGKTAIVAPEALSRFYTKGFFGKVGATWMTKEDRLAEIADYVNYLQQLIEEIKTLLSNNIRIHILGFSQGCATVCRWVTIKKPDFDGLWICSGSIPDDLDWQVFKQLSNKRSIRITYGLQDPFLVEGDIEKVEIKLKDKGIRFRLDSFDGAHEINVGILKTDIQKK